MIAIAAEEGEGEVVPRVESEFEKAHSKHAQKEEYVGRREPFSKGFRLCRSAYFGVSRVVTPFAERLRVGKVTFTIWAAGHWALAGSCFEIRAFRRLTCGLRT